MTATELRQSIREPIMSLKGIGKSFGPVRALEDVSFDVYPGRVHGLVGENGAGKSTLVKIITGLEQADEGEVVLAGKRGPVPHPDRSAQPRRRRRLPGPETVPAPLGRREHRHGRLSARPRSACSTVAG